MKSNRYVVPNIDEERMKESYLKEFDAFLKERLSYQTDGAALELQSIFFGGGSPSLAPTSLIKTIIDHTKSSIIPSDDLEITLEANPTVR